MTLTLKHGYLLTGPFSFLRCKNKKITLLQRSEGISGEVKNKYIITKDIICRLFSRSHSVMLHAVIDSLGFRLNRISSNEQQLKEVCLYTCQSHNHINTKEIFVVLFGKWKWVHFKEIGFNFRCWLCSKCYQTMKQWCLILIFFSIFIESVIEPIYTSNLWVQIF